MKKNIITSIYYVMLAFAVTSVAATVIVLLGLVAWVLYSSATGAYEALAAGDYRTFTLNAVLLFILPGMLMLPLVMHLWERHPYLRVFRFHFDKEGIRIVLNPKGEAKS